MKIYDVSQTRLFGFYDLMVDDCRPIPLISMYNCFLTDHRGRQWVHNLIKRQECCYCLCGGSDDYYNLAHLSAHDLMHVLKSKAGFLIRKSRRSKKFRLLLSGFLLYADSENIESVHFTCHDEELFEFANSICNNK